MYTLKETVLTTRIDDESVLLDSAGGKYYGLNKSGTRMLETLIETGTLEQSLERLVLEYDIERQQLRDDLESFVQDLVQRGFLVQSEDS
jgi:hypothetical protein